MLIDCHKICATYSIGSYNHLPSLGFVYYLYIRLYIICILQNQGQGWLGRVAGCTPGFRTPSNRAIVGNSRHHAASPASPASLALPPPSIALRENDRAWETPPGIPHFPSRPPISTPPGGCPLVGNPPLDIPPSGYPPRGLRLAFRPYILFSLIGTIC